MRRVMHFWLGRGRENSGGRPSWGVRSDRFIGSLAKDGCGRRIEKARLREAIALSLGERGAA